MGKRIKNKRLELTKLHSDIVRGVSLSYRVNYFNSNGSSKPTELKQPLEIVLFYAKPSDDQHVSKIELSLN